MLSKFHTLWLLDFDTWLQIVGKINPASDQSCSLAPSSYKEDRGGNFCELDLHLRWQSNCVLFQRGFPRGKLASTRWCSLKASLRSGRSVLCAISMLFILPLTFRFVHQLQTTETVIFLIGKWKMFHSGLDGTIVLSHKLKLGKLL